MCCSKLVQATGVASGCLMSLFGNRLTVFRMGALKTEHP